MSETDKDRAIAICQYIHEQLGQRYPNIEREWKRALVMHEVRHEHPDSYDEVQACLNKIRRGEIVYVIGGAGVVRVDPQTGIVVDGTHIVGVERVEIPRLNDDSRLEGDMQP